MVKVNGYPTTTNNPQPTTHNQLLTLTKERDAGIGVLRMGSTQPERVHVSKSFRRRIAKWGSAPARERSQPRVAQ
jgi:hypothetical protein